MFNRAGCWEKVKVGVLRAAVMKENHPAPQPASEPFCTRSQMIFYTDEHEQEIARVHQYLRPDGSIGGSGKPDPKRFLHQGTIYIPI
jgi:hypothetical protein